MSAVRTRSVALLVALTVALPLVTSPQPAPAAVAPRHEVSRRDATGDVVSPHIDIRAAGMSYTTRSVRLKVELIRSIDVQARRWRPRSTRLAWTLDTDPGSGGKLTVLVRRRAGRLQATMTPIESSVEVCRGAVRVVGRSLTVSLPRAACLNSPTVRGWVQTTYVPNPGAWEPTILTDRAPSRRSLPAVSRPRGLSELRFGLPSRMVVPYGSAHTITGLLSWGRWQLTNRPVTLYRRWSPQHPWTSLGTERTDEYGGAEWWPQHAAVRPAQFVLRFSGDARNAPSRSSVLQIVPAMVVQAELHPG
ncbi:MAG: hypothetical protein ICV72_14160, partial [Aldersonia sp.]|nr:hypothetical protein [Aldersonia sp.]